MAAVSKSTFYYNEFTLAAGYSNFAKFKAQFDHLKIAVSSGSGDNCVFNTINDGSEEHGKILEGETQSFDDFRTGGISVKGQGTARVWAW
jgi:hypothetical protein